MALFTSLASHAPKLYVAQFALFARENRTFIIRLHVGAECLLFVFLVATALGLGVESEVQVVSSHGVGTQNSDRVQESHVHQTQSEQHKCLFIVLSDANYHLPEKADWPSKNKD